MYHEKKTFLFIAVSTYVFTTNLTRFISESTHATRKGREKSSIRVRAGLQET